ncbi:DUF1398 domain-containing protein [Terracidiphilus gabretensis]|uniref:DUF1398 domain-containing protein n=1 Tax=Terracidiphilus gabretensis TaxID=1577687 RepID=UPI000A77BFE8|nr:DUF1398 family protein [Terracidiphilus gabretensis]
MSNAVSSKAIENLQRAMQHAETIRPKVGGFPYLAEVLRQAGATHNLWYLPSCHCIFQTQQGAVAMQAQPLISGIADIPAFDQAALITALRTDQAGHTTFPEFLEASWKAGIVKYEVDFAARTVTYYGVNDEAYVEEYPAVAL